VGPVYEGSMSRVLCLLDFDHRPRIQFFHEREYALEFRGQRSQTIMKSKILFSNIRFSYFAGEARYARKGGPGRPAL